MFSAFCYSLDTLFFNGSDCERITLIEGTCLSSPRTVLNCHLSMIFKKSFYLVKAYKRSSVKEILK